jgi:hypothetical protein
MIENFLRRPQTAAEVTADALRVAGLIGVLVAAVWWTPTDAGVLAFTLPGLLIPRFVGVRPWFDITYCVTLLVAAWSNVFDLYTRLVAWDLVVHLMCTGVLAAVLYLLLARLGIVADPDDERVPVVTAVITTTVIGLAVSALWEMVEWFGHAFLSDEIFVAYEDTIADLAIGGLGAVLAGFAIAYLPVWRRRSPAEPPPTRVRAGNGSTG